MDCPGFFVFGGPSRLLIKRISLIVLCMAPKLWAASCHPIIPAGQPAYLIGYGSLISGSSRQRTVPSVKRTVPVWVDGWQRGFFKEGHYKPGSTFLGVRRMQRAHFNALMFKVPHVAWRQADRREGGYCRQRVARSDLIAMQGVVPVGSYWMYVPKRIEMPDAAHPIVQSYVDLFLGGCLSVSHHFAKQCVRTTRGWSKHWVNDRVYPRRPWVSSPQAMAVEQLLESMGVKGLSHRRIE